MKTKLLRIVLLAAFAVSLLAPTTNAQAAGTGCSWTGSVDANWSTPGNWGAGCTGLGGIPGTGDTLTFPLGASNATMTDDLPAITLQSLIFSGALDYTLNGANAISLTGGVDVQAGNQTINTPLTVGGAGVAFHTANGANLTFGGALNLGTYNGSFTVDSASNVVGIKTLGAINGSGAAKISKYGTGELQITGDQSSKTFDIDINAGSVGTDPTAWTGLPSFRKITIASGANLNTRSGAMIGAISGGGEIHASSYFQIRQLQTTTFTGDIFGSQQMAVVGNGSDTLTIDRSSGSLSYAGEINVNASSKLRIVNTTATSVPDFLAAQGTLELNNSHVGVILVGYSGGGFNYDGSLILSGATPNIASSITLRNNSTVTSVINSSTDYGRINVASPVDLGAGAPTFALQGSYTPIPGDVFNIIQNTGAGTATKTNAAFSNLAQGGTVTFNTTPLTADYLAGGNTRFALLAPPDVTPPTVQSILRAGADPTNAATVDFTVTFSESVTGVDMGDFVVAMSGVSGATVSGIAGSGSLYTLTVSTGTGNGTIRLDTADDDSVLDLVGNPLGGAGADNGKFTGGETYTIVRNTLILRSSGVEDGHVLESTEISKVGGTFNSTSTVFNLGDDAQDRQYRGILHFDTSSLPDNAVVTKVTLKIRKQGQVGVNPFATLGKILVDIRTGAFSNNNALQATDFHAAAHKNAGAVIQNTPVNNWYSAILPSASLPFLNLTGVTQFRLRFQIDDNDNGTADYLKFYGGNFATAAARPTLIIEYYVP